MSTTLSEEKKKEIEEVFSKNSVTFRASSGVLKLVEKDVMGILFPKPKMSRIEEIQSRLDRGVYYPELRSTEDIRFLLAALRSVPVRPTDKQIAYAMSTGECLSEVAVGVMGELSAAEQARVTALRKLFTASPTTDRGDEPLCQRCHKPTAQNVHVLCAAPKPEPEKPSEDERECPDCGMLGGVHIIPCGRSHRTEKPQPDHAALIAEARREYPWCAECHNLFEGHGNRDHPFVGVLAWRLADALEGKTHHAG